MSAGQRIRPWWACTGDPCTCPPVPGTPVTTRTVYGIRPHRTVTAAEAELLRVMAEATPPITVETLRAQGLIP